MKDSAEILPAVTLGIDGMTCAGCAGRAERALAAVPGVASARVQLTSENARVTFDQPVETAALVHALDAAGYPARIETTRLEVEGMTCASCAGRVERALAALPGVIEARVTLASETAFVTHVADAVTAITLAEASTRAGYPAHAAGDASEQDTTADRKSEEARQIGRRAALAGLLTLPVFIGEMGGHLFPPLHHAIHGSIGTFSWHLIQFLLITAVMAGPGRVFYAKGLPALFRGAPEMNALVAIGTLAAWGYSSVATFAPGLLPEEARAVYFEAAGVIVALILLGRWLEARAKGRTGEAIRRLVKLRPAEAHVDRDGAIITLPVSALRNDDIVVLRPGDAVPVDGTVISGESRLDEAMLTGEAMPVAKSAGDPVSAGTVNGSGTLKVRAERVGSDTALSRIIAMVEEAEATRLPIQSLVDRITAVFVPAVMVTALVTFLVWLALGPGLTHALVAGVAVLIIACPCAMGLATPTSIVVGAGRAAALGVLFRRGDALQQLERVAVVAFDKTGTLTMGEPGVTDIHAAPGVDETGALRLAAGAEVLSEHPLARAIVDRANLAGITDLPQAEDAQTDAGFGLSARVDGHAILIGNARLMQREGIDIAALADAAEHIAAEAATPVFVAIDGALALVLAISDALKPDAAETVARLHEAGMRVAMLSGDAEPVARAIAARLGIDDVRAGLLPGDKLTAIDALRAAHGPVAFVGDGINDAPALAQADVGIAIGTGTDVAIESADVVLMSGAPLGVVTARDVSRRVMRNIRQNLGWAFGYNILLIPVAAGLLYPAFGLMLSPMLGAGAMALSSVFVLGNALRLRAIGPAKGGRS